MNKSPAFQFYASDFLVSVMGMTEEDIGIRMKMLATQWVRGSLPVDPRAIKKLIGMRKVPTECVMKEFPVSSDGFRKCPWLEEQRVKQAAFRESRVQSANKRWGKASESNTPELPFVESTCNAHAIEGEGCVSNARASNERSADEDARALHTECESDARASDMHVIRMSERNALHSSSSYSPTHPPNAPTMEACVSFSATCMPGDPDFAASVARQFHGLFSVKHWRTQNGDNLLEGAGWKHRLRQMIEEEARKPHQKRGPSAPKMDRPGIREDLEIPEL